MIWNCPECHAAIEVPDGRNLTFCPICGARYIPSTPLKCDAVPATSSPSAAANPPGNAVSSDGGNRDRPAEPDQSGSCREAEFRSGDSISSERGGAVPGPEGGSSPRTYPPAGPWNRYAARMIDFFLEIMIISFFAGLFKDFSSMNDLVFNMIFTPPALLLDCLIYTGFGQTLGKWLFGFKVVNDSGMLLTAEQYFRRNIQVYIRGFGLGLPLIGMCTSFYQHDLLNKGQKANYDRILKTQVIDYQRSILRKCAGFLVFLLLLSLIIGTLLYEKMQ